VDRNNINYIVPAGFPRSGNTFLYTSLKEIYKNKEVLIYTHSTADIKKLIKNKTIVCFTFRNPVDSVASWFHYRHNYLTRKIDDKIEDDLNFWIRINSYALENKRELTLLNFHRFSNDLVYIQNTIKQVHNIDPTDTYSIDEMKEIVFRENEDINLPRDNQPELEEIRNRVVSLPLYSKAVELLQSLEFYERKFNDKENSI
jgi:phage regulator Rha-like protein